MKFSFHSWGVQRKSFSFPEVYLKLRDDKNREIVCIYNVDDIMNEKLNIRKLFWDLVNEVATEFICNDEWLKDVRISDKYFENLQFSIKNLLDMKITLTEFLKEWDQFEFKFF